MSKHIGVMLVTIDPYYQIDLWKGLQSYGKDHDVVFYFFCGSPYEAPQIDFSHYNSIYNLINTEYLDGIIMMTGTLGNYVGKETLHRYLSVYGDVPNLSISVDFPEMLVVRNNNRESLEGVMTHLVEVHGYQDIAIITGPMTNIEAVDRLEGYKASLERYGIPYDPLKVVEGKFNRRSGAMALNQLYLEHNKRPEVILCSNDDMAIGAFYELEKLGYVVGRDVYLVGYDDLEQVKYFNPPLTTVKLPLFQMGYMSAKNICDYIDGKSVDRVTSVKGDLVIRESCGCFQVLPFEEQPEVSKILADYEVNSEDNLNFERWLLSHAKLFIDLIVKNLEDDYKSNPEVILNLMVDFRSDVMHGRADGMFLKRFNRLIQRFMEEGRSVERWKFILYNVMQYVLQGPINKEMVLTINEMFYLANTVLSNVRLRTAKHQGFKLVGDYNDISNLISSFHMVLNNDQLIQVLTDWTDRIGIDVFSLCLFKESIIAVNNGQFDYPKYMNALYTRIDDVIYFNVTYEAEYMIPTNLFSAYGEDLVFFPIHFQERHFGYLITNTDSAENLAFKHLREQIGTTLDRIHTYSQLETYNQELRKLSVVDGLTELYNHRGFYNRAIESYKHVLKVRGEMAIVYSDLDGLKQINDTYGHQEGDYAISVVGHSYGKALDHGSFAGRVGGDEFIVMVTGPDCNDRCEKIMDRVQNLIDEENDTNGKPYDIRMSFGSQVYDHTSDLSLEERINRADQALYKVKRQLKKKVR